jgi:CheY-like chemotaxis protein/two-component sensor histidine kinase
MNTAKIELLNKYNELLSFAQKNHSDFAEHICEFLVSEYELQAVVLFKITEENKLMVLGKSSSAKKTYLKDSVFDCPLCKIKNDAISKFSFNSDSECELQTTDYVIYEACVLLKINHTDKAFLKIAKKTPFTQTDKNNFEIIGDLISGLLGIWFGHQENTVNGISKIITEIAHELRTPTNSIMGFASLLHEDNLSSSQSEYVSTLKENAFNLLSLINDLVDIAKIENGILKPSYSQVNLRGFIEEIVKIFIEKIDRSKIEFLLNFERSLPESVKIDSQKLRFILTNIITTSIRLTEKGKISISAGISAQNKLNIKITDTSSGLSASKVKEIFKPFALNESGYQKTGSSTGLGLALVKKYIEILNGEIEVTSSYGKGTAFSFTIPLDMISSIESQLSSLPKPAEKKSKVLVIEDDYATSKLLSNYLNKWGYEPTIVNSGEQALKMVAKEVYLAILMDIVLPDANGFELIKKIKENKLNKNTPVIVCSVEAEQQKAFLMGAVEYFVKPIKYKFLVEVLTSYKLKKDSNILCVDDDLPTLTLIKEAIEQSGFNAIAEAHSSKVMTLIENMHLDLAIIDLDMPELNGFDLIKQIKSNPRFSKLPIVIYTGKENYQEEIAKIDGLFTDLLHKSSSKIEDLADTINQMINRDDDIVSTPPEEAEKEADKVKILLVEDYKHSQIIVTRLLKKNDFDSIVVVENGAEAVDQVKKQKFDLILMDMQMPVMNGFEATQHIRNMEEYKEIPIIALTAFAMKGDRERCLEAGATDYIAKPIDSQEFIEKVKYYTQQKK